MSSLPAPIPFPKATIDIFERDVPAILKSFCLFIGRESLERRIKLAEKMLTGASPTYRELFVKPKQSLWLGTNELLRLSGGGQLKLGAMTAYGVAALHHMTSLRNVVQTMPSWRKRAFRSRLTDKSGGDLPALIEIAAALRIVTLGGRIKWMPEGSSSGRVFEMLASFKGQKFEVECKAKTVDAGRQLVRASLYQFVDRLISNAAFMSSRRPRSVSLVMDGRFPADQRDQIALVEVMVGLRDGGNTLRHGSAISVETVSLAELRSRAQAELGEYEHRFISNDLVVSLRSRKTDHMIASIEDDLRDALEQFSGNLPSVVCCYVPEVDSFEGVEKAGTATYALVHRFLSRPEAKNVVSLWFFSDPRNDTRTTEIETGLPSVRFLAEKFRASPLAIF